MSAAIRFLCKRLNFFENVPFGNQYVSKYPQLTFPPVFSDCHCKRIFTPAIRLVSVIQDGRPGQQSTAIFWTGCSSVKEVSPSTATNFRIWSIVKGSSLTGIWCLVWNYLLEDFISVHAHFFRWLIINSCTYVVHPKIILLKSLRKIGRNAGSTPAASTI